MSTGAIFGQADLLIVSNDAGGFYVPGFGVDAITTVDAYEGYSAFANGANAQSITVEGSAADLGPVTLDAFQVNSLAYLPQDCMSTDMVFSGYENNLLVVQNDAGGFYVPSFGVMTLTEMCPGDGYSVFLNGADGIDFTYPSMAAARSSASLDWADYNEASASVVYADRIVKTGISHPIILTSLEGANAGDELVAYAGNQVIGATRITEDSDHPVVLAAWGAYQDSYGIIDLPGYELGDDINLRLYSVSEGRELYIDANLSNSKYGDDALTTGTGLVVTTDPNPVAYDLMQNYPNPFNPSTSISFSIPERDHVKINIYDMTGRLVSTLVNETLNEGVHMVSWNGQDSSGEMVSAGVYIYALESSSTMMTKKMIFLK